MRARTTFAVAAAVLFCAGNPGPAHAQANPNANEIVKSLTPNGTIDSRTRGIRIGQPHPGAGAPANAPSVSLNIEFATGSAELTPPAVHALDQLGEALNNPRLAADHFRIEGHTDTVGSASLNQALSERRAQAVVSYLSSKFAVNPSRLRAVGMGERGLLVATPKQTAEARNRRVLIVNIGS